MSLTRNEIKFIKSLQDKKTREAEKLFVVEGIKPVSELLMHSNFKIKAIYTTRDQAISIPDQLPHHRISETELERISGLVSPNVVLAVAEMPEPSEDLPNEDLTLILDEIKDPGNLGTILRTADWFGIQHVTASFNSVDLFNPKVVQASMGAVFRVNYKTKDLINYLTELKKAGYELVGADLEGVSIYDFKASSKTAIVMGSESHGISPEVKKLLNKSVTIPKFGKTESLNVAIATGIILGIIRGN